MSELEVVASKYAIDNNDAPLNIYDINKDAFLAGADWMLRQVELLTEDENASSDESRLYERLKSLTMELPELEK